MNVADTVDEARTFVDRHGWSWNQIQDPLRERAERFGATYQPHFILVDAHGRVVATHEGGGDASVWGAMLARLP